MEEDRFVLRSITDEIMYELMLLSHQEYVDVYAASMKNRLVDAARAKAKELHRDGLGRSAATVPPPAAVEPSVPPAGPGDERAAS
jgi:1-acyl-sn-glycerol-3-phosphate acyltransferase